MSRILAGALFLVACGGVSLGAQTSRPVAVTVMGEVLKPGILVSDKPLTLLAAIAEAGGFTGNAAVIEIRRRSTGTGPVTNATPASEYQSTYALRVALATKAVADPSLAVGDFVIVRRELELHPPMMAGEFGAGAYRLNYATWGVTAPVVRTSREPEYTLAGMRLKLQGTVDVEAVVNADGTVADARVVRSLDARKPELVAELRRSGDAHSISVLETVGDGPIGLDANAVACVKTWTFAPGTILGQPTPVIQTVSVPFKLR